MKRILERMDRQTRVMLAVRLLLFAVFVAMYVFDRSLWPSGMTVADATIFSLTGRFNPHKVAERIRRQQWRQNIFGPWVAPEFMKRAKDTVDVNVPQPEGVRFTGSPIEVHDGYMKEGKTTIDIPVMLRLNGRPVFGDKSSVGKAQKARVVWRTVEINQSHKTYAPPQGMSAQVSMEFLEQALWRTEEICTTWLNDYHPGNIIYALLTGQSLDLAAPTTEGGRGKTIISHPNFVVAGSGEVSYAGGKPGTTGYEASVEAALNTLADQASDYMTVKLVRSLGLLAQRKRIAPIVIKGGFKFYAMWIGDAQWQQLQNDPVFEDRYKRLPVALEQSPLATGAMCMIGGVIVYVDQNLMGARTNQIDGDVTAGTVEYGVAPSDADRALGFLVGDWVENRDTSNYKIGFIIGQNALSVGVGIPLLANKRGPKMRMTEEITDHGKNVEMGLAFVQSFLRTDEFDQDGMVAGNTAGDFYENTGSLVFATYSPDAIEFV